MQIIKTFTTRNGAIVTNYSDVDGKASYISIPDGQGNVKKYPVDKSLADDLRSFLEHDTDYFEVVLLDLF